MNAQDFCYWLQGYFEIAGNNSMTDEQVAVIKEHLQLVFNKVTTVSSKPQQIDEDKLKKAIEEINKLKEKKEDVLNPWPVILPHRPYKLECE